MTAQSLCRNYWSADTAGPLVSFALPREIVEAAVFVNASVGLELRTDGNLVAHASHVSMQTLVSTSLIRLVNETLRPQSLALEKASHALIELEAQLARALASVQEFRSRRDEH
jgi:hypothetical protein